MEAVSSLKPCAPFLRTPLEEEICIEKFNELLLDLQENHQVIGFPVEARINELVKILKARYARHLRSDTLHERTFYLLIHHTVRIKNFCNTHKTPLPSALVAFDAFLTSSKKTCRFLPWLPEQVIQKKGQELCLLDPSERPHIVAILEEIREVIEFYYVSLHDFEEYEQGQLINSFHFFMCNELSTIYRHLKGTAVPDVVIQPPSPTFTFLCEIDSSFFTLFTALRNVPRLTSSQSISYGILSLLKFTGEHGHLCRGSDFEKPLVAIERIFAEIPEKSRFEVRHLYFLIDLLNEYGKLFEKASLPFSETYQTLYEETFCRLHAIKGQLYCPELWIDSSLASIFDALPHPTERKVPASIKDPRYHAYDRGPRVKTVEEAVELYLSEKRRGISYTDIPDIYDVIPAPPPFSREELEEVAYPHLVDIDKAIDLIVNDLSLHTPFEQRILLKKIRMIFTNAITRILCKWKRTSASLSILDIQKYTRKELADSSPKSKATNLALTILRKAFIT